LVRIESASIVFPKFSIKGEIRQYDPNPYVDGDELPGLLIRTDGFALGVAELTFGYDDPNAQMVDENGNVVEPSSIKFGSILEFDDIRIGVQNFVVIFEPAVYFRGSIYVASGGAKFFPGRPISAEISDRDTPDDRLPDGSADTEAIRLQLDFEYGRVKSFVFEVDTLAVNLGTYVSLKAVGVRLDTGAAPYEELVSFIAIGAEVKIGSLLLGGEARNFAFLGDGSFITKPGFGVFIKIGSASGESFKWPSWLPIQINEIGIQWDDIQRNPADFTLTLSASVEGIQGIPGLTISGAIEGVKIKPSLLLAGKFPIIDITSIAVSIEGDMFGGTINAGLERTGSPWGIYQCGSAGGYRD